MARAGKPTNGVTWYLRAWMDHKEIIQARMMEKTGWSRATMSQLYNGEQDFNPKVLREAADALGLERFELLMTPEDAMALRQVRAASAQIARVAPLAKTGT